MLPEAYIVHQLSSRVRLRIDDMRNNNEFFDQVIEQLASLDSLTNYYTNRSVGSIVLVHEENSWQEVLQQLEGLKLFTLVNAPARTNRPAIAPLLSNIRKLNQNIDQGSGGSVDLRTLALISLLVLTIRQALQGNLVGPALPLLLSAWGLIDKYQPNQSGSQTR